MASYTMNSSSAMCQVSSGSGHKSRSNRSIHILLLHNFVTLALLSHSNHVTATFHEKSSSSGEHQAYSFSSNEAIHEMEDLSRSAEMMYEHDLQPLIANINQPQDQQTSKAESFAAVTTLTTPCDNPCLFIKSYSLQPLYQTNCKHYALCQDYEETYRFTCPPGEKFDDAVKKCVAGENVECVCPVNNKGGIMTYAATADAEIICEQSPAQKVPLDNCKDYVTCRRNGKVKQVQSCQEGYLFDSLLGICNYEDRVDCSSTLLDSLVSVQDNMNAYSHPEEEVSCSSVNSGFFALPGCQEYVQCSEGEVVQTQSCSEGLIFDINMQGCNWAYMVECTTYALPSHAPTVRPTAAPIKPTQSPTTSRPTEAATPKPTMPETFPPISDSPTSSDGFPQVLDWIRDHVSELNQHVFRSYSREGLSYRSYWFQYSDFINALTVMSSQSITGDVKHIFYLGNEPREWEYGLINVVAFLSQAMTESISKDACDEYSWEVNSDVFSQTEEEEATTTTKPNQHYALSNSCGQGGMNYQEFHCGVEDAHMECGVDRNMKIQATTGEVYPNAPPPLTCRPRTTTDSYTGFWNVMTGKESNEFPYENSFGRTDVEGCCFWGRGALHTKGVCNMGKLNYYLGKQAAKDGRTSRYPSVDFCSFPEAICAGPESREMRWVTSMFEWTERIQTYDDGKGWNYIKELQDFVDTGMYNVKFLYAVSGIVTQGCPEPPCRGATASTNGGLGSATEVRNVDDRVTNFNTALVALEAGGEKALVRALTNFFSDKKDVVNSKILQSQTPEGQLYPSYRYQLSDFLSALTAISEEGVAGKKFYTGDPSVSMGVRYGVVNAVMFLAQSYKESIQYDACDENNWSMVNDRFPISNSCGQLDMSYQDMHCSEDEAFMECPLKPEMEQYALTSALWFQAPGPFKCGPKSKFPTTGYWDYDLGKENNKDAYANDRGRVDVENCCWWGRGIIQTRGVCSYGKLNYYLGMRAAKEGRRSLYPTLDFCDFPQGVCSSDETYGGELQWMVGLFEWVERIQSYNKDGWNYLEELKTFVDGGYEDFDFVDRVSSILNLGCPFPPCTGISPTAAEPHNQRDRNDVFQRFLNQLQVVSTFPAPPPPTPLPTPYPTEEPSIVVPTTGSPTEPQLPTLSPTITPAPTSLAGRPPKQMADDFVETIQVAVANRGDLAEVLLTSNYPYGVFPSYLYTWKTFIAALEKMTKDEVGPGKYLGPGNWFYIGEAETSDYGLVNVAAFLAYGFTQSIYYDACDENNWEVVDFRYPLSNSCGQGLNGGLPYEDQVCTDEDEGLECKVDTKMEIYGVTHASWIGAPQPLYCGDKTTGYWDHVTGLERNDKPFKNAIGRSDVKGCCWWGRGVLQVRGVCQYGKLNYHLGAKGAAEQRQSMYPDIDFCLNPGAICSDRRAPELRWVTGMFYWANQIQRNRRDFDYLTTLKEYVNAGDFEDSSFIDALNTALGGSPSDMSNRTDVFFNALKIFGLIEVTSPSVPSVNATVESDTVVPMSYCGFDYEDASRKCSIICQNSTSQSSTVDSTCPLGETCFSDLVSCATTEAGEADSANSTSSDEDQIAVNSTSLEDDQSTNATSTQNNIEDSSNETVVDTQVQMAVTVTVPALVATSNYCGATWASAAIDCTKTCPSGMDGECGPGQFCFGGIETCTANTDVETSTSNWCGRDWNDAASQCLQPCPSGIDSQCPPPTRCFGDVFSC